MEGNIQLGAIMRLKSTVPATVLALMSFAGALVVTVAANAAGSLSGTTLLPDSTYSAPKSTSGALAQTDPALLGRTDSTPVNVLIKYDFDGDCFVSGHGGGPRGDQPVGHGQETEGQQSPRASV
jgi:hypothetical protein